MSVSTCATAEKDAGDIRKKGSVLQCIPFLEVCVFGTELQIVFKHPNVLSKHEGLLKINLANMHNSTVIKI